MPEYWIDIDEVDLDFADNQDPDMSNGNIQLQPQTPLQILTKLTMLFLLLWGYHYGVSGNAMNHLIKYLHYVISCLQPYAPFVIANLVASFPTSLPMLQKQLNLHKDHFTKFVVCPTCHKLYNFDDCIFKHSNGQWIARKCSHVQFPRHPQLSQRKECGESLLKEVVLSSGSVKLYPIKIYPYKSIKESLVNLLERNGILDLCERWRRRFIPEGYLGDVYNGRVWKNLKDLQGEPFFNERGSLGLMFNYDWFQPFDFTVYSVGEYTCGHCIPCHCCMILDIWGMLQCDC